MLMISNCPYYRKKYLNILVLIKAYTFFTRQDYELHLNGILLVVHPDLMIR